MPDSKKPTLTPWHRQVGSADEVLRWLRATGCRIELKEGRLEVGMPVEWMLEPETIKVTAAVESLVAKYEAVLVATWSSR